MKKFTKYFLPLLALATVFSMIFAGTGASASTTTLDKQTFVVANNGSELYQWGLYHTSKSLGSLQSREISDKGVCYAFYNSSYSAINDLTSGNPAAFAITADTENQLLYLKYLKAGSGTVSFNLTKNDDVYSFTGDVSFVPYKKPVSKLIVGKTGFTGSIKASPKIRTSKTIKGIVKVTPAKGWKVKHIYKVSGGISMQDFGSRTSYSFSGKSPVKTKKSVSIPKSCVLEVVLYNSSLGRYESVWLGKSSALKGFNSIAGGAPYID